MHTPMLRLALLAAAAAVLGACQFPTRACTDDLRIHLAPNDTTIRVGTSFQPRADLRGCSGRQQLSDRFTWKPSDPAIVASDPTTGSLTGLAVGDVQIAASGERFGRLGTIHVVVEPAH